MRRENPRSPQRLKRQSFCVIQGTTEETAEKLKVYLSG